MIDGPFNDILRWRYERLPDVLGQGRGFRVETEAQLVDALREARDHTASFCLISVNLSPTDISPALRRLTVGMRRNVQTPPPRG